MTCSVTLVEGFYGIPSITWLNSEGQPIYSAEDIILQSQITLGQDTNLTLFFDPIRTSDAGSYTCTATFSSVALPLIVNSSANFLINVQQSKF